VLIEWQPAAVRRIGRPGVRWECDVGADLGKMKIHNWCVNWLWIEKHGRELLSGPKLKQSCSVRRRRIKVFCSAMFECLNSLLPSLL
jgi:hypothetical protein